MTNSSSPPPTVGPSDPIDSLPIVSLPIVGVGASAGGLEALERTFRHIDADSGAAYVVIQHLSPDFESHMQQLLSRVTPLRVQVAADNQEVLPDEVYLIPPGQDLTIDGRRLHLTPRNDSNNFSRPIDAFFTSLAAAAGPWAAAVVLSGTGSDGSRGIVEVDQAGGMVIAQLPQTCAFDAMPVNAAATGCVDAVIPPEQIGQVLRHYFDPQAHRLPDPPPDGDAAWGRQGDEAVARRGGRGERRVQAAPTPADRRSERLVPRNRWAIFPQRNLAVPGDQATNAPGGLRDVFEVLWTTHQIDFELYKAGTIGRRLERRMQRTGATSLDNYVDRLRRDPGEVNELYRDLLINVTEFFRDRGAFEQLRAVAEEKVDQLIEKLQAAAEPAVAPDDSTPPDQTPQSPTASSKNVDRPTIRVWICGCATGEEAYSVAIVFAEALQRRCDPTAAVAAGHQPLCSQIAAKLDWRSAHPPIKIFATDAHRDSLQTAGTGVYDTGAMLGVSQERRESFFEARTDRFAIRREIRRLVVFAPHDLTRDPPFTQIDLVTCRNVLIYLQSDSQHRALCNFHFALRPGGCLWLGPSETLGSLKTHFETVDGHWKMYRRQAKPLSSAMVNDHLISPPPEAQLKPVASDPVGPAGTHAASPPRPSLAAPNPPPTHPGSGVTHRPNSSPGGVELTSDASNRTAQQATELSATLPLPSDLLLSVYDQLLGEHMPPSILTDDSLQVLHVFAGCEDQLRHPPGRPTRYLPDLVDPRFRKSLLAASLQCRRRGIRVAVPCQSDDSPDAAGTPWPSMVVQPVPIPGADRTMLMIRWMPPGPDAATATSPIPGPPTEPLLSEAQSDLLEIELQHTRQNLQTTIEELETTNEELQATNEEMVVSNEELQSTNEELHGVNEELYTVNAEHQRRVRELDDANQDMDHLLAATQVGVLFLDQNLLIRRFTPETSRLFDLTDQDVGRRIDLFCATRQHEPMLELIRDVSRRLRGGEAEVVLQQQTYLIRAVPMLQEKSIRGVVVALINIEPLKAAQSEMTRFKFMCDQAAEPHGLVDARGRMTYGNAAMARSLGCGIDEVRNLRIDGIDPTMTTDRLADRLSGSATIADGPGRIVESTFRRVDGTTFPVEVSYSPVTLQDQPYLYLTARDITERHRRDAEMQLLQKCVATVTNGIVISDPRLPDNPITFVNNGFMEMTGYRSEEILGRNCRFLQGKVTSRDAVRVIRRAIKQQRPCRTLMVNYRKDGTAFWNDLYITPVRDDEGEVTHYVGVQNDVTERVRIGESARSSEQTIRLLLDSTAEAILGIDNNNLCMFLNASAIRTLGLSDAEAAISHDVERLLQLGHDPLHHYPRGKSPISQAIGEGVSVNRSDRSVPPGRRHFFSGRILVPSGEPRWADRRGGHHLCRHHRPAADPTATPRRPRPGQPGQSSQESLFGQHEP